MEDIVKIVERLGSLGILVLLIWRVPAIIDALKGMTEMVIDKIGTMQDKNLSTFKEQQNTERALMTTRFELVDKNLERVGQALEASIKIQNEMLVTTNDVKHRLEKLEDRR